MPSYSCRVEEGLPPELRLDRYAAEYLKLLSRSQIKARGFKAFVNGREVKNSFPVKKIKTEDTLEFSWSDPEPADLLPEDIPLDIIYEDERVVVVNKAQGMVVHPGAGNPRGTLANALLFRRAFRGAGGGRPGIVHRLDKDTSGVIIAAWDDEALAFLAEQFKARRVKKIYGALVQGTFRETQGTLETLIGRDSRDRKKFAVSADRGKMAVTKYRIIRSWGNYSLVLLRPKTGRTHQLRVHLRYLGHPIVGDPVYGTRDPYFPMASLMLHARSLGLVLPGSMERRTFKTSLPGRFRDLIACLREGP